MFNYRRHLIGKPVSPFSLSVDNTTEANLRIDTISGNDYKVNWGDGIVETFPSGTTVTHTYSTNFTGSVKIQTNNGASDISIFASTGSTAWIFDLGVFVPLTGLTEFTLDNLPNANITGNSLAFSNKTNLSDFTLFNISSNSTIIMNYDDILNIWQSNVQIMHGNSLRGNSGISASKATTAPFNFDSLSSTTFYFQNIGLSTQSMDNMILALNSSIITQSNPKTIYLNGNSNAPHSGNLPVMAALSGLASKNITVVL